MFPKSGALWTEVFGSGSSLALYLNAPTLRMKLGQNHHIFYLELGRVCSPDVVKIAV